MAATQTLESFLNTISKEEREKLADIIKRVRSEMFAARSEDARVRLAHDFIEEVRTVSKRK